MSPPTPSLLNSKHYYFTSPFSQLLLFRTHHIGPVINTQWVQFTKSSGLNDAVFLRRLSLAWQGVSKTKKTGTEYQTIPFPLTKVAQGQTKTQVAGVGVLEVSLWPFHHGLQNGGSDLAVTAAHSNHAACQGCHADHLPRKGLAFVRIQKHNTETQSGYNRPHTHHNGSSERMINAWIVNVKASVLYGTVISLP